MGRETRNSENAAQSSRHLLSHFFCYDISPRSRSEIRLNLYDLHLSAGRGVVSHGEARVRGGGGTTRCYHAVCTVPFTSVHCV